jgi:hypothetical protein
VPSEVAKGAACTHLIYDNSERDFLFAWLCGLYFNAVRQPRVAKGGIHMNSSCMSYYMIELMQLGDVERYSLLCTRQTFQLRFEGQHPSYLTAVIFGGAAPRMVHDNGWLGSREEN